MSKNADIEELLSVDDRAWPCQYIFPDDLWEKGAWSAQTRLYTLNEMLNVLMSLAVRQHGWEIDYHKATDGEDKADVQDALANGCREIKACKEAVAHLVSCEYEHTPAYYYR